MTPFTSKIFNQPLVNEPTAHTQELYAALDPVVQAVLTDKNADIDALLDAANTQVQADPRQGLSPTSIAGPRHRRGPVRLRRIRRGWHASRAPTRGGNDERRAWVH